MDLSSACAAILQSCYVYLSILIQILWTPTKFHSYRYTRFSSLNSIKQERTVFTGYVRAVYPGGNTQLTTGVHGLQWIPISLSILLVAGGARKCSECQL